VTSILSIILIAGMGADASEEAPAPRILLESGKDHPETRWFSAAPVRPSARAARMLAVGGFTNDGSGDVADLSVYELREDAAVLQWRVQRRGGQKSSIRTLRSADLDGDGMDELIALGRNGDEDVDSSGELRVFAFRDGELQTAAQARWQSGKYTHGFGMDLGDLDGDGRPEIVTGGFFSDGERESAQLRVWSFQKSALVLKGDEHWNSKTGETRINSISIGDLDGKGPPEIMTAGRTGQIHGPEDTNTAEGDQLTVWRFEDGKLQRRAVYESRVEDRSRIREVKLANVDGRPGLELLTVGRADPPGRRGTGGGKGTGGGNGMGNGQGQSRLRPTLRVLRKAGETIEPVSEANLDDATGEVRDLIVLPGGDALRFATMTADDQKGQRRARLQIWTIAGGEVRKQIDRSISLGDETRARQLVLWPSDEGHRLLTVGFVKKGEQILGQMLDWGLVPAQN
jgi:hypothetical protein